MSDLRIMRREKAREFSLTPLIKTNLTAGIGHSKQAASSQQPSYIIQDNTLTHTNKPQ
jgi:hypothetical protein